MPGPLTEEGVLAAEAPSMPEVTAAWAAAKLSKVVSRARTLVAWECNVGRPRASANMTSIKYDTF